MSTRPGTITKGEHIIDCAHGAGKGDPAAFIWLGDRYEFVDSDKKVIRSQWAVLCVPCFEQYRAGEAELLTDFICNVFSFDHDVKVDQGAVA